MKQLPFPASRQKGSMTKYISPQSCKNWHPVPFTKLEMFNVALLAEAIMQYRARLPIMSPCWMDEWAFGYIAANRDQGIINHMQAQLLFSIFNTEG